MNIKKWESFLNENIEFPLKKYLSIIKSIIYNKIIIGKQTYKINFESVDILLTIEWNNTTTEYIHGETDILKSLQNEFKSFDINIVIDTPKIDYNILLSTIQHELKHIYDLLYDDSDENTFLKVKPINILKNKYKSFDEYYYFINLVYESLKYELEARNVSIYDRFRWLKTYDVSSIKGEFKKTYTYKSLIRLSKFDYIKFIESFDTSYLINITNDFIKIYGGYKEIHNKEELFRFYKYWEVLFKESSLIYLNKANDVIDEIIIDSKPYNESKLNTKHLNFYGDRYQSLFREKIINFF
jgi:hypothetical protein